MVEATGDDGDADVCAAAAAHDACFCPFVVLFVAVCVLNHPVSMLLQRLPCLYMV